MAAKDKNAWILVVFIFAGLVIGGLLGELTKSISWLSWLGYSGQFGLESPLVLDLSVIKLTFACMIRINIASIIGLAIAIFIYRKV
ncbi:MAG: DUF4321 domain-containing protein [Clostridia bacterium]|nr:DUF4321 domain-containing protein [Clostridia bacterium]